MSPGEENHLDDGRRKREKVYVPFPTKNKVLSSSAATWAKLRAFALPFGIIRIS
jgi:hypothetical protein